MKRFLKASVFLVFFLIGIGSVKGMENIDTVLEKKYNNKDSTMNKKFKEFDYEFVCKELEKDLHKCKSVLNAFWCFHKKDDQKQIVENIEKDPKYLSVLQTQKTYSAAKRWVYNKVFNSFDLVLLYQLVRLFVNGFSELAEAQSDVQLKHKREAMLVLRWFVTLYPLYLAEIKVYADLCEVDASKHLELFKENLKYRFNNNLISDHVTFTELTKTILDDLMCEKLCEKSSHRPGALFNAVNDSLIPLQTWISFKNPPKDILIILSGYEMRLAISNIRKQAIGLYMEYMKKAKSWTELWDADIAIFKNSFGITKSVSNDNFEELSLKELTVVIDEIETSDSMDWSYLEKTIFPLKNEIKNLPMGNKENLENHIKDEKKLTIEEEVVVKVISQNNIIDENKKDGKKLLLKNIEEKFGYQQNNKKNKRKGFK